MKSIDEYIMKINKVVEYTHNLINADEDYTKLMEKLKYGNISDREMETLDFGLKEIQYWANKIEVTVNMKKIADDLKNNNEKK